MKRTLSIVAASTLAVLALGPVRAEAGLLNADSFEYTGTSLNGQNGGMGWSGGWFNTASTSNTLSDDGVSLNYPATFESPLVSPTPAGSRVRTGGLNASSSRLLASTINLAVDGTVMYASALVKKNRENGGGFNADNVLVEFVDAGGNRRWGLGIEGTGDKPWLNANGSGTPSLGPTVTPGDTYLLVAKIVSSAAGQDQAFLKVFGTGYASQVPFVEPTTWDVSLVQTTGANLDRIRIRMDTGNTAGAPGEVDEIRIGTTWESVVPEPASVGLLGLCAVSLLGRRRA